MMKKILAAMMAVLLLIPSGMAVAADSNDHYGYVRGYYDNDQIDSSDAEDACQYFVEFPNSTGGTDKIYFASFADAVKGSTDGFYLQVGSDAYYICDDEGLKSQIGSATSGHILDSTDFENFTKLKPLTIVFDSENHKNTLTVAEDITIDREVHFVIASANPMAGTPATQTINFTGKITIQSGGSLIQENGGSKSSATVTVSQPIEVQQGGKLELRSTGGVDSAETNWILANDSQADAIIKVAEGGTVTLTDLSIGAENSEKPAIITAGTVNIEPYVNANAKINSIQVQDNGSLIMNDTSHGTTNIQEVSIAEGGQATLNQGVIGTLTVANDAAATIDDADITTVTLNSGASVTLGEKFSKTSTEFTLPVNASVTRNGVTYTANSEAGSVDKNGNVRLPGGGTATENEQTTNLPANTLVAQNIIASGTDEMPTLNDDGSVTIPTTGGSVTVDGVTTEMPYGGKVDGENVSVTVQTISLDRDSVSLYHNTDNNTVQLNATVDPNTIPVTWSSSNPSVASVSGDGLVTAHKDGTAVITATAGNKEAKCTVTVSTYVYTGKYSYEVFTSVGDNGTLSVDRYATEGDKVTIEVTPDEAYLLDELVVTANGKEVELTDNGDGTYTFTMPSADVRISATFAEDPDWTEPEEPATDVSDIFIDVAPNAWYKDAVQYAYENGLMTGVSANEFAPDATTTRGMIVSMLARLEGVESANDAGFADVEGEWYATAVNWAASVGVVNGYEDNTFRPNDAITREQLAAILMNYASYKGEDVSARADLSAYTDQPSAWAEETMSWAVAEGLISGVTNTELQPQGQATRAQVAAILQRFLCK